MRRRDLLAASLIGVLAPSSAHADPPRWSEGVAGAVTLRGKARSSSVSVAREPEYELINRTRAAVVVELVSLTSLGPDGSRQRLAITSPRRLALAPRARRTFEVDFAGRALNSGGGLSYHRFELVIAVGSERASAIASNAYICRIPLRRPTMP